MAEKSPDAYRTISEAGAEAGLPAHVLRFWESKFAQLKPVKRAGGRRLYRPQDVALLKGLRRLLYDEGYTIKGAQKYLKDHGVGHVSALGDGEAAPDTPAGAPATTSEPAHEPSAQPAAVEPSSAEPKPLAASDETAMRLRQVHARLQSARDALRAVL
jgi:DNA-binding transcriptional MerR regulator